MAGGPETELAWCSHGCRPRSRGRQLSAVMSKRYYNETCSLHSLGAGCAGLARLGPKTKPSTILVRHQICSVASKKNELIRVCSALSVASLIALAGCASSQRDDAHPGGLFVWDSKLYSSPFEQLLPGVTGDLDDEEAVKENLRIEEEVAACMKASGFDYFATGPEVEGDTTTASTESRYFGFTESLVYSRAPTGDPNIDYYESLSFSGQIEYTEALNGESPYGDVGDFDERRTPQVGGCYGEATKDRQARTGAMEDLLNSPEYSDVMDMVTQIANAVRPINGNVPTDEVIGRLDGDWSDCMASRGFAGIGSHWDTHHYFRDAVDPYLDEALRLPESYVIEVRGLEADLFDATEYCYGVVDYAHEYQQRIADLQLEVINKNYEQMMRMSDAYKIAIAELEGADN